MWGREEKRREKKTRWKKSLVKWHHDLCCYDGMHTRTASLSSCMFTSTTNCCFSHIKINVTHSLTLNLELGTFVRSFVRLVRALRCTCTRIWYQHPTTTKTDEKKKLNVDIVVVVGVVGVCLGIWLWIRKKHTNSLRLQSTPEQRLPIMIIIIFFQLFLLLFHSQRFLLLKNVNSVFFLCGLALCIYK